MYKLSIYLRVPRLLASSIISSWRVSNKSKRGIAGFGSKLKKYHFNKILKCLTSNMICYGLPNIYIILLKNVRTKQIMKYLNNKYHRLSTSYILNHCSHLKNHSHKAPKSIRNIYPKAM